MSEVRFVSDVHLSPERDDLSQLFYTYLTTYAPRAESLYILGDLFDFYLGDNAIGPFEREVASRLLTLTNQGVKVYLMPGNRDFLLGPRFARLAGCTLLKDPSVITLGERTVLLKHGDDLCTLDKAHMRFRAISQSKLVKALFLKLPVKTRANIAKKVRSTGRAQIKSSAETDVHLPAVVQTLQQMSASLLIHGHTHRPAKEAISEAYSRITLSDWRDSMTDLCYNYPNTFDLTTQLK